MNPVRALWFAGGMVALALGLIGVALPLLPTTPFILLAAFAFARSSERWHHWLVTHRVFGPMIENWQATGAIAPRAKRMAILAMAAAFGLSAAFGLAYWILAVQFLCMAGAASFILTRPDA